MLALSDDKTVHDNAIKERFNLALIPLAFEHFTREGDVDKPKSYQEIINILS